MLLDPYLKKPYVPRLSYLVGFFEVYDREETLGEELCKYDPNNPTDRDLLIRRYCLKRNSWENFRHRQAQFDLLEEALTDPDFDFASIWEDEEDENELWTWPCNWPEIADPRALFQAIRDVATELWHEDLQRSSLPTLRMCREIPKRDLGSRDWLFSVDNAEAWKSVFKMAATPTGLMTKGPICLGDGLTVSAEGYFDSLTFRPPHWPPSDAFSYCEFDVSITGISDMEISGHRYDGPLRTTVTRLENGCYVRMEIGFDCLIECVALHVNISNVIGSHRVQKYG
jgi:hypothetical protein